MKQGVENIKNLRKRNKINMRFFCKIFHFEQANTINKIVLHGL